MHDRPLVHWDGGFRGRRAVAQCTVRSFRVVVSPPLLDQDLSLLEAIEDLAIEQFVSETGVEALAVSVLLWATRLNVGRAGTDSCNPVANCLRHELRAVV